MDITPPLLDKRTESDLAYQVERDLRAASKWIGGIGDTGTALSRLFGHLGGIIVARLNRMPEQHLRTFLTEGGIEPLPPRAATTQVIFTPEKDAPAVIKVPVGAQIATRATASRPEIIFETDRDINVTPTELVRCITLSQRAYSDRTKEANGSGEGTFDAFRGELVRQRELVLSCADMLTIRDAFEQAHAHIRLAFTLDSEMKSEGSDWQLEWGLRSGETWLPVKPDCDTTAGLHKSGTVHFKGFPVPAAPTDNQDQSLVCRMILSSDGLELPAIKNITITRQVKARDVPIPIDKVITITSSQNGTVFTACDPTQPFFPLGQRPVKNDAFYIQIDEAYARPGAQIEVSFDRLSPVSEPDDPPGDLYDISAKWEYLNRVDCAEPKPINKQPPKVTDFKDGSSYRVTYKVPLNIADPESSAISASLTDKDRKGGWLRARIDTVGFKAPSRSQSRKGSDRTPIQSALLAQPRPPIITQLEAKVIEYEETPKSGTVHFQVSPTDGQWLCMPTAISAPAFRPFTTPMEAGAMCLAFMPLDRERAELSGAFPAGTWIEIFFDVDESADSAQHTRLCWEYWNGEAWREIQVVDGTNGLSRRGWLGFIAPRDHQQGDLFGTRAYWLRVTRPSGIEPGTSSSRSTGSAVSFMPRIKAIRLNAVTATNAETLAPATLGSSTGRKDQTFSLQRPPVLGDVEIVVGRAGHTDSNSPDSWANWKRIEHLGDAGPTDTCFALDESKGVITFGDGVHGRIPLAGRDNIRVTKYRTHAGISGNIGSGDIRMLRKPTDALNDIQRVTNPEPASGGSDAESEAAAIARGPYTLKNRRRAVAAEDYEQLAREVNGVHRAYCQGALDPHGHASPGCVTVVVIPEVSSGTSVSDDLPIPKPEALRDVEAYLEKHCLTALASPHLAAGPDGGGRVTVTGPQYVRVQVRAEVAPKDPRRLDEARKDATDRLTRFLHPVTGGPDQSGWEPGQSVYLCDVIAEIERTPSVDHVISGSATLLAQDRMHQVLTLKALKNRSEDAIGMLAGSQVSSFDERIKLILAEPLITASAEMEVVVLGLQAGVDVRLAATAQPADGHSLRIASLCNPDPSGQHFPVRFERPLSFSNEHEFGEWAEVSRCLVSADQWIRTPILPFNQGGYVTTMDDAGRVLLTAVRAYGLSPGEVVSTVSSHQRHAVDRLMRVSAVAALTPAKDSATWRRMDRVVIPPGQLVCSGAPHDIDGPSRR